MTPGRISRRLFRSLAHAHYGALAEILLYLTDSALYGLFLLIRVGDMYRYGLGR